MEEERGVLVAALSDDYLTRSDDADRLLKYARRCQEQCNCPACLSTFDYLWDLLFGKNTLDAPGAQARST